MNNMSGLRYKISPSPLMAVFRRSMDLWLQCRCSALAFDILLYSALEKCEEILPAITSKSSIDIALSLARYRNSFTVDADPEESLPPNEPIQYVMIKKFTRFSSRCQENVLFEDQTTFGPLQFLRQLLLADEVSNSSILLDFDPAAMLRSIDGSQSLYDDAHGATPEPLSADTIETCRLHLTSVSALTRFFAGMALLGQGAYLDDITVSFTEILEKCGTADEISFAGVREEVQSEFIEFLRHLVNNADRHN